MDDGTGSEDELDRLRNLPIRSEDIGFAPEELIVCGKCAKSNAPNRAACLYCGAELEGVTMTKLEARDLESWENGFNVIVVDTSRADVDSAANDLARTLRLEREFVTAILRSPRPLPLARVESEAQAVAISEGLDQLGIETRVIEDRSLQPTSLPVRLRSLAFTEDGIVLGLFSQGEVRSIKLDDLAIIVSAVTLEERTESIEKKKRRSTTTVSEAQTSERGHVIDIYSTQHAGGWRIPSSGFDFSCLGPDKSLLVNENMERLVTKLVRIHPDAKLIDDYLAVRSLLENCWPSESRKDTERLGLGRKEFSSVSTTNNKLQLTKFSRLQWHLL